MSHPLQPKNSHNAGPWTLVLGSLILVGAAYFLPNVNADRQAVAELVVVALLGGMVGYGELVSRYRDNVSALLEWWPACGYILLNVGASLAALLIVQDTVKFNESQPKWLYEVLLASFGSVAFFRSSLFNIRVGNTDIGVGPNVVLKALLEASDRMIDRDQAQDRAAYVAGIMRDIDFSKASKDLPTLCFALVQNLSAEEQKEIGDQIEKLDQSVGMTPGGKVIVLGVYLVRLVGADVLEQAVAALGDNIRNTAGEQAGPGGQH